MFGRSEATALQETAEVLINEIQQEFLDFDQKVLFEVTLKENKKDLNSILERYVNPGHSLEFSWLVIHQPRKTVDRSSIDTAIEVIRWMSQKGWDSKYGGIFQFIDYQGGKPKGREPKGTSISLKIFF